MTEAFLLTSTFYGNWLPGDKRGFVGRVWEQRESDSNTDARQVHDLPGTPYDEDIAGLREASEELMRGPPVLINLEQAETLLAQLHETAAIRKWHLLAVAIMANHIHLVVQTEDGTGPTKILGDFKAYGSRALNKRWGKLLSDTWWTSKGSKRRLLDDVSLRAAIRYVLNQERPLVVRCNPDFNEFALSGVA